MNKRIVLSAHAAGRMIERGISRKDLQWMLANGTRVPAEQKVDREYRLAREGYLNDKLARVVYIDRENEIEIVTIMWVTEEA